MCCCSITNVQPPSFGESISAIAYINLQQSSMSLAARSTSCCLQPQQHKRLKITGIAHSTPKQQQGLTHTQGGCIELDPSNLRPVQCLKEWAVTCAALGAGQQTVLLRKGGIREPTFTPQAERFLLFPTGFHTEAQLLKPGVAELYHQEMLLQPKEVDELPLQYYAEVTGAWTTQDANVLQALDLLHVYADGFLETRLKWRAKQPLTLLELRCYTLERPLLIPVKERESYFGCFSWVQLEDADVSAEGNAKAGSSASWKLQPALSDEAFQQKQAVMRNALQQIDVEQLQI